MQEALRRAQAEIAAQQTVREYELRGANLRVQTLDDEEIVLSGPAGTGKSLANLVKLHQLMSGYAGARGLIVRKVRADLAQSTLVTYERDVLGLDNPICAGVTREGRQSYKYPNGSEVVVGGMDRPGKILSADYDLIVASEATQFELEDWETFIMRLRTGVIPQQQLLGDTNPDQPHHWLKQRADAGLTLLLETTHRDNPKYWDNAANDWTKAGRDYVLGKLSRLTGVRKLRYLDGKWVIAEGAVYEDFSDAVHVIDRFDVPAEWRRIRSIDFGYTNPFSCSWYAIDPDGRMYRYRQIYMTRRRVDEHAALIRQLSEGERIEATVADHDAEDRATLHAHGIPTVAAKKEIASGIQAVQKRLQPADDGRPRLFFLRGSLVEADEDLQERKLPTCTEQEMPGYVWPKGVDGKPNKEVPVDEDNHGLDELRYAVMYLDRMRARSVTNSIY